MRGTTTTTHPTSLARRASLGGLAVLGLVVSACGTPAATTRPTYPLPTAGPTTTTSGPPTTTASELAKTKAIIRKAYLQDQNCVDEADARLDGSTLPSCTTAPFTAAAQALITLSKELDEHSSGVGTVVASSVDVYSVSPDMYDARLTVCSPPDGYNETASGARAPGVVGSPDWAAGRVAMIDQNGRWLIDGIQVLKAAATPQEVGGPCAGVS